MRQQTYYRCPKCGTKNRLSIDTKREHKGATLDYCDIEQGGCDAELIVSWRAIIDVTYVAAIPDQPEAIEELGVQQ